jgi:serine protease inhibitor
MNALYFKGDWTNKFDKSKTTNRPFQLNDGSTIEVSTMIHDELGANYYSNARILQRSSYLMDAGISP